MGNILLLSDLLNCPVLKKFPKKDEWFNKRDEIKQVMAAHLLGGTTETWLSVLEPADIWCARVMDYDELVKEEGYKVLEMELKVRTKNGLEVTTTRCPIRVDGELLLSDRGAPALGEHNIQIEEEFMDRKVPVFK
jgi:crotonobetainyl-CoA:carnitine CoA-transferase CaiB-like acyl-CoA transferase